MTTGSEAGRQLGVICPNCKAAYCVPEGADGSKRQFRFRNWFWLPIGVSLAAAGFGIVALVAHLSGKAQNAPPARANARDDAPKQAPAQQKADRQAHPWGRLARIPEFLGPGSELQKFLRRLEANQPKPIEGVNWELTVFSIDQVEMAPSPKIGITAFGTGVIDMELHLFQADDAITPYVLFGGRLGSEYQESWRNRDERVLQVGRALGLTRQELRRLLIVLAHLPVPNKRIAEKALTSFVRDLPQAVQQKFLAACTQVAIPHYKTKDRTQTPGPAIGCELSERFVADIGFCPLVDLSVYSGAAKVYKFGHWWTVALHPAFDDSYTRHGDKTKVGDGWVLPWPRLTPAEVDALMAKK
jgi:hypothetical protein